MNSRLAAMLEMNADVECWRPRIYRWAYRLVRNHEDALDVTQGVLVRRLSAGALQPEKLAAWLRRVTFNLSIDTIRRRRPAVPFDEAAAAVSARGGAGVAADPPPLQAIREAERHDRVLQGLQDLSELQRQVLLAKTFDGLTFAAIAESLGLAISSVKTHYVRALRKMRDRLREEDAP